MKYIIQICLILIAIMNVIESNGQKPISIAQYKKDNLNRIETYRDKLTEKEHGTNILRADYHVCYSNNKYTNPENIALDYLKSKSAELGISQDLNNVRVYKTKISPEF